MMACEYCDSPIHKSVINTGTIDAFVTTDAMLYIEYHGISDQEYVEIPINYCPMCGERLGDGE